MASWTGTITLDLINVSVKLSPCTSEGGANGKLLADTPDGWKLVKRPYVTQDGESLEGIATYHGFDTGRGWVVLSDNDLASIRPERSKQIQLDDFVPLASIDRMLHCKPYWAVPAIAEDPNYALLVEAMRQAKLAGVGRYVKRTREYPVAVFAHGDVLVVDDLFYTNQVSEPPSLRLPKPERAKVRQAVQMIKALALDSFDPERYVSDYDVKLTDLINERAEAGELVDVVGVEREPAPAQVPNIMDAFQKQLEKTAAKRKAASRAS